MVSVVRRLGRMALLGWGLVAGCAARRASQQDAVPGAHRDASREHAHGAPHEVGRKHEHDGRHGDGRGHAPGRAHGHAHRHGHAHGGGRGHSFGDADGWAAVFDDPARDAWQKPEEVTRLLALTAGMVVADVGAGTGYFLPHLSRGVGPHGRVLARDLEPDMVRYIKARAQREALGNVEADTAREDDPVLPPASVDRILTVDTWHHIEHRGAYAERLARALRPGGFVLVVDFTLESPEGPPPAMRVAPDLVVAELRQGGLDAERLEASLPNQYVIRGRRRGP